MQIVKQTKINIYHKTASNMKELMEGGDKGGTVHRVYNSLVSVKVGWLVARRPTQHIIFHFGIRFES